MRCLFSSHVEAAFSTNMPAPNQGILRFRSHRYLRQRLLLAVLSGNSIRVDQIRSEDVHVGLRDYEINLLRLLEKVTNGSTIEISVTGERFMNEVSSRLGTSFLFHPGLMPGGSYTHTCHVGRSIGYYLELLIPLAPFCKKAFDITLHGITGEEGRDMTVSPLVGGMLNLGGHDPDCDTASPSPLRRNGRSRAADHETRRSTSRRWTGRIQVPHYSPIEDIAIYRERQDKKDPRCGVSAPP